MSTTSSLIPSLSIPSNSYRQTTFSATPSELEAILGKANIGPYRWAVTHILGVASLPFEIYIHEAYAEDDDIYPNQFYSVSVGAASSMGVDRLMRELAYLLTHYRNSKLA